jgi:hypothetical protein
MAINDRGQMRPAIRATRNVGHIHRPPLITGRGLTPPAPHSRPRRARPLMDQPTFEFEDPIDHFAIHPEPLPISQQRPQAAIPKGGMLPQQP